MQIIKLLPKKQIIWTDTGIIRYTNYSRGVITGYDSYSAIYTIYRRGSRYYLKLEGHKPKEHEMYKYALEKLRKYNSHLY